MPISVSEWRVRIGGFNRRQTEIPQETINVEDVNAALRSQQACGKAPVDDQRTDAIHVPVTRDYKRTRKDKSSWSKKCGDQENNDFSSCGSHPTQNHTHRYVKCDPCPITRANPKCFFGSTSPLLEMFARTIDRYDYFNSTSNQSTAHNTPLNVNDVSHRYRSLLLAVIGMLSELYIAETKLMRAGDIETNPGPKELDGKRDAVVHYELGFDEKHLSSSTPSDGARQLQERQIDPWLKDNKMHVKTVQATVLTSFEHLIGPIQTRDWTTKSIEHQHEVDKQNGDDSASEVETKPAHKEPNGKRDAVVHYAPSIDSNIPPESNAPLGRELGFDEKPLSSLSTPSDLAIQSLDRLTDSWFNQNNWDEETAQKNLAKKVRSIEIQHDMDKQKGDDSASEVETKPGSKEPNENRDAVVHYVPSIVSNIPPEYYAPLGRELGFDEKHHSSLSTPSEEAIHLLERLIDAWLKEKNWDKESAQRILAMKVRSIEHQHKLNKQKEDESSRYIETKPGPKEHNEKRDSVVHNVPLKLSNIPRENCAPIGRELGFDKKYLSSLATPSDGARQVQERPTEPCLKENKMDGKTAHKIVGTELENVGMSIKTHERPMRYGSIEHEHEMDKQKGDNLSNERIYDTMEHIITVGHWKLIDILKDQLESATDREKYRVKAQIISHLKSKGARDPAFEETSITYKITDVHKTWDLLLTENITKPSLSSDEAFFNYIDAILHNSKISDNSLSAAWEILSLSDEGSSTKHFESTIDPANIANLDPLPHLVNLTSTDALAAYTCALMERYRYYEVLTFEASDALSIDSSSPHNCFQDTSKMQESSSTSSSDEIFLAACSNQCRLQRECVVGLFERKAVEDKLREMKNSALTEIHLTGILDVEISPDFTVRKCRHMLMDQYKATVCKVHTLPHEKGSLASVEDVYTTLTLCKLENQRVHVPNSVEGIFATEFNGKIPSRICLFADAGKGKSTAVAKLAYNWVSSTSDTSLANLPLLFVIKLCSLDKDTSLEQTILSDLLGSYKGITHEELKVFIEQNQKCCWFIFDGLDEYAGKNDIFPKVSNNIVKVITNQMLHQCRVLVTGRYYINNYFDQGDMPYIYAKMDINGYSEPCVELYIDGFFGGATSETSQLKAFLNKNAMLQELVRTPLFCVMICHLWRTNHAIFDSESLFLDKINQCLWDHYLLKRPVIKSGLTMENIINKFGEMALNKLLLDPNSLCFIPEEFLKHEEIFKLGLEVGIISSKGSTTGQTRSVYFYNALIRDHVAAKFIAMKTKAMLSSFKQKFLEKILTKIEQNGLSRFGNLIRFIACKGESLCLQVLEFTMHSQTLEEDHKHRLLLHCLSEINKPGEKLISFLQRSFRNKRIVVKFPTVYTARGFSNIPQPAMHKISSLRITGFHVQITEKIVEGLQKCDELHELHVSIDEKQHMSIYHNALDFQTPSPPLVSIIKGLHNSVLNSIRAVHLQIINNRQTVGNSSALTDFLQIFNNHNIELLNISSIDLTAIETEIIGTFFHGRRNHIGKITFDIGTDKTKSFLSIQNDNVTMIRLSDDILSFFQIIKMQRIHKATISSWDMTTSRAHKIGKAFKDCTNVEELHISFGKEPTVEEAHLQQHVLLVKRLSMYIVHVIGSMDIYQKHKIEEFTVLESQLDPHQTSYLWGVLKLLQHLNQLRISGLPPLKNVKLTPLPSVTTLTIDSGDLHSYAHLMNSLCNIQKICIYLGNLANDFNNIVSFLAMARQGKGLSVTIDGQDVQGKTIMRTSFDMSRELQECTDVKVDFIRLRNFTNDEAHLLFLVKCFSSIKSLREIGILKCSMKDDGPLLSYLNGQNTRSSRDTLTVVVMNQETLEYNIHKGKEQTPVSHLHRPNHHSSTPGMMLKQL